VTLGDAVSTKSPYEHVYSKVTKNSVTICHLSPAVYLRGFLCRNEMVTGWIDLRGAGLLSPATGISLLSEACGQISGDSHLSRGSFLPTDEDSLRRRNL